MSMVRGRIGRDEALENIVRKTRRYARRQRTWFRRTEADVTRDVRELDVSAILVGWRDHEVQFGQGREDDDR